MHLKSGHVVRHGIVVFFGWSEGADGVGVAECWIFGEGEAEHGAGEDDEEWNVVGFLEAQIAPWS